MNRALTQNSLFKEHEALRRYVTLLEAGQRIATTLDRDRLVETATSGFLALCGADATALYIREERNHLKLTGWAGVPGATAKRSKASSRRRSAKRSDAHGAGQELELTDVPGPYETAFLLPIVDGENQLGAVLLLFAGDIPEAGVEAGAYLGRHLALALKNLGRFAEVENIVYLSNLTHLFNSRYLELVLDKEFDATKAEKPFAALPQSRLLQERQRHARPRGGLEAARRGLTGAEGVRARRRRRLPLGWRRVCAVAAWNRLGWRAEGRRAHSSRGRESPASSREGFGLNITTCIGIASYPEHAQEKDALLDFANRAMYRGKKGARNIIYMASKGLEATPAARHQTLPPATTSES